MENILNEVIKAYDSGEIDNFKNLARRIYNSFAVYPSNLGVANHKYLLGQIFSDYAPFLQNDIDAYTTAIENAYFCLSTVVIKSENISERNCAAIRMLLLVDENRRVMLNIASRFIKERSSRVCDKPAINISVLNGLMNNAFDEEVLRIIGGYLISEVSSSEKKSFISENEMNRYNELLRKDCYSTRYSLFNVSPQTLFLEMRDYIRYVIDAPYERRMKQLK